MKDKLLKHLNIYAIVASMVMLTGFLGYWLQAEFEKEKQAISLERNDNFFKGMLTFLETDTINEIKFRDPFNDKDGTFITLRMDGKDEGMVKRQLAIEDSLIVEERIIGPEKVFQHRSQTSSVIRRKSVTDSISFQGRLEFNPETKEMDTFINIEMNADLSKMNDVLYMEGSNKIKNGEVFSRMIPQVSMSFVIFGSVLASFFFMGISLKKQRQLAIIQNDFVSNITHELKTPISTIGVALEAMKNFGVADRPGMREEYLDITMSEIKRLGLIVEKALNISLFEKGNFNMVEEEIDLETEVEEIRSTLQIYNEAHQTTFEVIKKGANFKILGDQTHLVNVIHNLIENGIKYSEPPVKITVMLEEKEASVILKVKDEGIGIPKEYLSKVFDKFFRVPKGDIHDAKGHGLGLSYVKMIVEKMKGRVNVWSEEGKGSEFILEFPKSEY